MKSKKGDLITQINQVQQKNTVPNVEANLNQANVA